MQENLLTVCIYTWYQENISMFQTDNHKGNICQFATMYMTFSGIWKVFFIYASESLIEFEIQTLILKM